MKTLMTTMKTAARNRLAYHRTVTELQHLPLDVALDLDINPGDARRIAHKAVYGA